MAVKFAASFGAEVTMLSHSPSKEADAKKLGAHYFALTSDPEVMKSLAGEFDVILNTVSADHDYNEYLKLLNTNGTMIVVGMPSAPAVIPAASLVLKRKSIMGSLIGGIAETQEMLDYCAEHNIISDVEVINMDYINEAYERMNKSDVKYRFVIDMASMKKESALYKSTLIQKILKRMFQICKHTFKGKPLNLSGFPLYVWCCCLLLVRSQETFTQHFFFKNVFFFKNISRAGSKATQ
jgi:hypothetical protein